MDYEIMKKRLDTYRRPKGQYRGIKGELLLELLKMWEQHTGPSIELAKKLGMRGKQLGRIIAQARKLAMTTGALDSGFHELATQGAVEPSAPGGGIEVSWGSDKVIRFPTVDVLMDFLKKAS